MRSRYQNAARQHDLDHPGDDPTRFLFPSTDGAELLTRWDMQETPPDILVTNASMLSTMLTREVEMAIFEKTRAWLESEEDAQFFLVLDELHLIRGSSGTEIAGLLRALFNRLGVDQPKTRHKLRILASSASLPTEGEKGMQSVQYLNDFFGPFGTYKDEKDHGLTTPSQWLKCIVPQRGSTHRRRGDHVDRALLQAGRSPVPRRPSHQGLRHRGPRFRGPAARLPQEASAPVVGKRFR